MHFAVAFAGALASATVGALDFVVPAAGELLVVVLVVVVVFRDRVFAGVVEVGGAVVVVVVLAFCSVSVFLRRDFLVGAEVAWVEVVVVDEAVV